MILLLQLNTKFVLYSVLIKYFISGIIYLHKIVLQYTFNVFNIK